MLHLDVEKPRGFSEREEAERVLKKEGADRLLKKELISPGVRVRDADAPDGDGTPIACVAVVVVGARSTG